MIQAQKCMHMHTHVHTDTKVALAGQQIVKQRKLDNNISVVADKTTQQKCCFEGCHCSMGKCHLHFKGVEDQRHESSSWNQTLPKICITSTKR
ncbi:unnamed protein product [Sphagnum jensenii]|uniref:Uncharacterized protein n=1 Tax=Sphagnum jensenii TaxID=128206 RepID=A0ABP1AP34_9BRYO